MLSLILCEIEVSFSLFLSLPPLATAIAGLLISVPASWLICLPLFLPSQVDVSRCHKSVHLKTCAKAHFSLDDLSGARLPVPCCHLILQLVLWNLGDLLHNTCWPSPSAGGSGRKQPPLVPSAVPGGSAWYRGGPAPAMPFLSWRGSSVQFRLPWNGL